MRWKNMTWQTEFEKEKVHTPLIQDKVLTIDKEHLRLWKLNQAEYIDWFSMYIISKLRFQQHCFLCLTKEIMKYS